MLTASANTGESVFALMMRSLSDSVGYLWITVMGQNSTYGAASVPALHCSCWTLGIKLQSHFNLCESKVGPLTSVWVYAIVGSSYSYLEGFHWFNESWTRPGVISFATICLPYVTLPFQVHKLHYCTFIEMKLNMKWIIYANYHSMKLRVSLRQNTIF